MLNGYEKFAAKSVPKFVKSSRKSYEIALTVIMGHHGCVLLCVVGHWEESINFGCAPSSCQAGIDAGAIAMTMCRLGRRADTSARKICIQSVSRCGSVKPSARQPGHGMISRPPVTNSNRKMALRNCSSSTRWCSLSPTQKPARSSGK